MAGQTLVPNRNSFDFKKWLKNNTMIIVLIGVALLFELMIRGSSHGNAALFNAQNITNIINQNAYVVILATGMLLCILTGGNVDLSVGSVLCFVGAIGGKLMVNPEHPELQWPVAPTIIVCLLIGLAIGAFHGAIIAYLHVPPFITTLAGMLLWRGLANVVLEGMTISPMPEGFMKLFSNYLLRPDASLIPQGLETAKVIVSGLLIMLAIPVVKKDPFGRPMLDNAGKALLDYKKISISTLIVFVAIAVLVIALMVVSRKKKQKKGYTVDGNGLFILKIATLTFVILGLGAFLAFDKGIPVVLILLAIVVGCYAYFTQNTVPGRYLYAIGGNVKAAKLSGIKTDNVMFFAYANNGFIAALAALVVMARFNSAAPTAGNSYEMDAIASCFIGGASAYGGTGTVGGAVIGAVFMGVLNNGMSLLNVDANWQKAVKGLVLLAAVIFDVVSKKKKSSK